MFLRFFISTLFLGLISCHLKTDDGRNGRNGLNDPNPNPGPQEERIFAKEEDDSVGEKLFYLNDFTPNLKLNAIKAKLKIKTHPIDVSREIPELTDDQIDAYEKLEPPSKNINFIGYNFKAAIKEFEKLGGRIRLQANITQLPTNKDTSLWELEAPVIIPINQTDLLIPICNAGENRSQVLYLALNNAPKGKYHVTKPHAAEGGFDPYPKDFADKLWTDIHSENARSDILFKYIFGEIASRSTEGEWLQNVFYSTFDAEKSKRIGQITAERKGYATNLNTQYSNLAAHKKVASARYEQRKEMNKLLYNADRLRKSIGTKGQVQFFLFSRASFIILSRLLEQKENTDFTGIVLNMYSWGDFISQGGGEKERAKASASNDQEVIHASTDDAKKYILSARAHMKYYELLNETLSYEAVPE